MNIKKNIFHDNSGRCYYIDLGYLDVRNGEYDKFNFDADGIPRYSYFTSYFPNKKALFYNINFICHFALYQFALYKKYRRKNHLDRFIHIAEWIIRNGQETSDSFTVPNEFAFHGIQPPWNSSLSQGRILSVLSRAWEITNKPVYLNTAKKALTPLEIPVAEGGLQSFFPDGGIGFEEYPHPKPNLVLNGLITTIVGLHDLSETGELRSRTLFNASIDALEQNLARYDLHYWSAYDLKGPIRRVASEFYHNYHIMQLWALYEMTGKEVFKNYTRKWQGCRKGIYFYFFRNISLTAKLIEKARIIAVNKYA